MKLYRKFIRPMHGYPGPHYEPKTEPIEKEEKWYPEEEREHLEIKYGYLNKRSFSDLVFDDKYEEVEMPEIIRCKDCKHYMTINCSCDGCCISDDWYCPDGER